MKSYSKFLFLSCLPLILCLISCNACTKSNNIVPPGNVCTDSGCPMDAHDTGVHDTDQSVTDSALDVSTCKIMSGDTWEFTVPNGWESKSSSDKSIAAMLFNDSNQELIMLLREDYNGPVEGYIIEAIRGVKGADAKLISSKQTEVNGVKYTILESKKGPVTVWAWVTVKNNFGYVFTCGGDESEVFKHQASCLSVMNTFRIK